MFRPRSVLLSLSSKRGLVSSKWFEIWTCLSLLSLRSQGWRFDIVSTRTILRSWMSYATQKTSSCQSAVVSFFSQIPRHDVCSKGKANSNQGGFWESGSLVILARKWWKWSGVLPRKYMVFVDVHLVFLTDSALILDAPLLIIVIL